MKLPPAKIFFSGVIGCCLLLCLSEFVFAMRTSMIFVKKKDASKILKEIYQEMKEFEKYPGCDFIKREFWMDLDGNEGNKEEHVVVMRHDDGHDLKMTVQVTYYMPDKGLHWVRFAHATKSVLCCIRENGFDIYRSDYSSEEMTKLFPEILKGIRNKKEILKLIKKEK